MWGLGLDPDTAALIETAAGEGFSLRNLPPDAVAWMRGQEGEVQAAWIPWQVWQGLPKSRRRTCRTDDGLRRILIIGERDEQEGPDGEGQQVETEQVLADGFLTALRAPLTRSKVRDALLRMRELDSLSAALRKKTEEVMLERELLARKSSHLSFLNRVLSRASASLDAATILTKAKTDLRHLLPVDGLSAVFWSRTAETTGLDTEMYLHCRMAPQEHTAWQEILLATAERMGGAKVTDYRQICLAPGKTWKAGQSPSSGRMLMLPLSACGESFGCLVLMTTKGLRLAKDQVQTLNAAVNHLALALRNALLFRQVKSMADHDGLTKIANRRSFEEHLEAEALRHGRYGQPLSLLLFDIDHFKRVNDTLGHQVGDTVLREMAGLLGEGLRATDFPARYGGEEFAVLLPHTGREQASLLAERIREKVAQRRFAGEHALQLSVSAGVASLSQNGSGSDLVLLADQALYLAKNGGRDRVVVAGPEGIQDEKAGADEAGGKRSVGRKPASRTHAAAM
jgi:diguanylate cyclase (GGDEF)-like protein